jgi:hypothetical protein
MSLTTVRKSTVVCGACGTQNRIPLVELVDADRRHDQRQAILERTLQRVRCSGCEAFVRSEPDMIYFERSRDLWITAYPRENVDSWSELEPQAQVTFDDYRRSVSDIASRMGQAALRRRVTFGWEALREKLLLAQNGLDDVTAELCKLSLIRDGRCPRPDGPAELRFCEFGEEDCTIATVVPAMDKPMESTAVPRSQFDEIGAGREEWRAPREELSTGSFVDLRRLNTGAM